ncbi:radical SAM protein [Anaerovibrio slackiae]|nr:radical SAM protein [Anaerovibrio slackiae]
MVKLTNNLKELSTREGESFSIYGYGKMGKYLELYLRAHNIEIRNIIDTNPQTNTKTIDEVIEDKEHNFVVPVYNDEAKNNITDALIKHGYGNINVLTNKCLNQLDQITNKKLRFQTHLVEHCNLKCRGCYHFSSLAEAEFLSLEEYEKDVRRLSELFDGKMEEILLLGGEPLLHPLCEEFLYVTRKYFKVGKLKVLSNGTLLLGKTEKFFKAFNECSAELWITKYPISFDYDKAEEHAKSYGVDIKYFNREPVRTLGHQPLDLEGKQDFKQNYYNCYRANECVDLKHGKLYSCIIPAEIAPFVKYFKMDNPVKDTDGVDIYAVKDYEDLLERLYMPMEFCRFCNRNDVAIFGRIPWQRSMFDIKEWTL